MLDPRGQGRFFFRALIGDQRPVDDHKAVFGGRQKLLREGVGADFFQRGREVQLVQLVARIKGVEPQLLQSLRQPDLRQRPALAEGAGADPFQALRQQLRQRLAFPERVFPDLGDALGDLDAADLLAHLPVGDPRCPAAGGEGFGADCPHRALPDDGRHRNVRLPALVGRDHKAAPVLQLFVDPGLLEHLHGVGVEKIAHLLFLLLYGLPGHVGRAVFVIHQPRERLHAVFLLREGDQLVPLGLVADPALLGHDRQRRDVVACDAALQELALGQRRAVAPAQEQRQRRVVPQAGFFALKGLHRQAELFPSGSSRSAMRPITRVSVAAS